MSITMREVALRAGVSKATVSYVLNGREASMRIPEETRSRILRAVAELEGGLSDRSRRGDERRSEAAALGQID